jgi:hypothetical protein
VTGGGVKQPELTLPATTGRDLLPLPRTHLGGDDNSLGMRGNQERGDCFALATGSGRGRWSGLRVGRQTTLSRAAPETSAFPPMQHRPTFAGGGSRNAGPVHDGAPQLALCGLSLGSGWAAAAHFDATQPSRKPPLRTKTSPFAGALAMEPTGIEPATSWVRSALGVGSVLKGADLQGVGERPRHRDQLGGTRIVGDYRGLRHFWR